MIRTLIAILTVFGLMSLSNCEQKSDTILPPDPGKVSGEWKLVEPASAYEITLILEVDPTAQTITGALPYRIAGKSAVNQYFALATFGKLFENGTSRNDGVSFGTIGATKMAGSPEAMRFEALYFTRLNAVNRFEIISPNRLRLYYQGEQAGVLVYEKTK